MSTPNNEPERAFPSLETNSRGEPYYDHLGMTLRDWFAGQALMGSMASDTEQWQVANVEDRATMVYLIADAMLAARERKGGEA